MSALQYGIQISDTKGSCPRLSSKLILPPLKPIAYPASSIHSSENALQDGIISINKILTVRLHLVDFFLIGQIRSKLYSYDYHFILF